MQDLTRWLAGDGQPSPGIFLKVVDVLLEAGSKSYLHPARQDGAKPPENQV
jgi:hypothetical protein